jgi:hypothetical protein
VSGEVRRGQLITSAGMPEPRPTPTQAFRELAMAYATRQASAPENSVSLSRNAKGHMQFEVVVRGEDVTRCRDLANLIVQDLERMYPYPVTNGGTE